MSILYQPQYRVHGTVTWSNWGSPIATTSTIVGANPPGPSLTPSTQYDFQIVASNSFGSTPSAVVTSTTAAGTSITGITLSNQSFIAGGTQGTIVGSVNVTLSSGTFSGSLTVTGTDAAIFQSPITGGNLTLSGASTTARSYNINIVAAQTGLASFTQNFPSITATSASQESAEGFIVNTVGPILFSSQNAGFASPSGPWDQFSLVNTGTGRDPQISLNGSTQTATGLISELIYHNHTTFQENTSLGWWRWDTTGLAWVEYGVSSVALSASSYAASAPVNTLIGTISVTMKDGNAFNGVLSVDDITHFKIVGNQLQAATTLSATSYPITITAVPAVSGANKIGEQGTLSQTIAQTGATGSLIQVPVGVWLGPFLGGGAQWATSINAHWTAFNTDMGRTATHLGAVMTNAAQYGGNPSTWGSGESGQFAANSIPNTVSPLTTFVFTNGTSNVDFTDYANGTFDSQIQSNLNGWKNAGFTKMYIRVNWEFNDGGPNSNFVFPSQASIATWVSAYKHFANVCHTWGNNNGVTMRIIWSPTTNNGHTVDINGTSTTGIPVSTLFPIPDGNGTGTGGRYIDVIGCDLYAFGFSVNDPTVGSGDTNLATNTGWFLKSYVEMCQQYNCNLGFSEAGIVAPYSSGALTTWCNTVGNYLNTLSSLSPAVPIEYWTIYDVHTTIGSTGLYVPSMTNTTEATFSDYLGNFKALFGGPQNSRSVMTIPPI